MSRRRIDIDLSPTVWSVPGHAGVVTDVARSPGGRVLASCGTDGDVALWRPGTGAVLARRALDPQGLRSLCWLGTHRMLAVGGEAYAWLLSDRVRRVRRVDLPEPALDARSAGAAAIVRLAGGGLCRVSAEGVVRRIEIEGTTDGLCSHDGGVVRAHGTRWQWLDDTGGVLACGDLAATVDGQWRGLDLAAGDRGRFLALVHGEDSMNFSTLAAVLIDPRNGLAQLCPDWTVGYLAPAPHVAADGKPVYFANQVIDAVARMKFLDAGVTAVCAGPGGTMVTGSDDGGLRCWRVAGPAQRVAGSFLDGAARRRGEIATRTSTQVQWWSALSGQWLRSERVGDQVQVAADGSGLIALKSLPFGEAQIEVCSAGWSTPTSRDRNAICLAEGGRFAGLSVPVYRVESQDGTTFPTPHRKWGGAVAWSDRVVSWDRAGEVLAWRQDGVLLWQRTLAGGVCAAAWTDQGELALLLQADAGTTWVEWLEPVRGQSVVVGGRSDGAAHDQLLATEEGDVIAPGWGAVRYPRVAGAVGYPVQVQRKAESAPAWRLVEGFQFLCFDLSLRTQVCSIDVDLSDAVLASDGSAVFARGTIYSLADQTAVVLPEPWWRGRKAAFLPAGHLLLYGREDGRLIWAKTGACLASLGGAVHDFAVSARGDRLALAQATAVVVLDLATGHQLVQIATPAATGLGFDAMEMLVIACGYGVTSWSSDGTRAMYWPLTERVTGLCVDGHLVAAVDALGRLRIVRSGEVSGTRDAKRD